MNKELIELITDTVSKRTEVDALSIYNACETRGFVRGTYTSYISMMKKAGYLRRVKPQVYAIGRPASSQTIALNLQRLQLHKKGVSPKMPPNAPEPKKAAKMEPEPLQPFTPVSAQIMDAVGVLKSYGLKVTIEF